MTQTFTPALDLTAQEIEKELQSGLSTEAEPSENTIRNILNFSRNLEVKQSSLVNTIEVLKS